MQKLRNQLEIGIELISSKLGNLYVLINFVAAEACTVKVKTLPAHTQEIMLSPTSRVNACTPVNALYIFTMLPCANAV